MTHNQIKISPQLIGGQIEKSPCTRILSLVFRITYTEILSIVVNYNRENDRQ